LKLIRATQTCVEFDRGFPHVLQFKNKISLKTRVDDRLVGRRVGSFATSKSFSFYLYEAMVLERHLSAVLLCWFRN
jgi:hypothetical protein